MEQFNALVESLHRLYKDKKIDESYIYSLYVNKKIKLKEKEYILSE